MSATSESVSWGVCLRVEMRFSRAAGAYGASVTLRWATTSARTSDTPVGDARTRQGRVHRLSGPGFTEPHG